MVPEAEPVEELNQSPRDPMTIKRNSNVVRCPPIPTCEHYLETWGNSVLCFPLGNT